MAFYIMLDGLFFYLYRVIIKFVLILLINWFVGFIRFFVMPFEVIYCIIYWPTFFIRFQ
jgi:hypothetical protein